MTQTTTQTITAEDALERFTNLFVEVDTLGEDIKALAAECKDAELDVGTIKACAKLIAAQKYADWHEKTGKIAAMLEAAGK